MEFNEIMKKLRTSRGLSQAALADKLNMSQSIIGAYETGDRKPSYEAMEQIADFFNVSLDYLRGKDEGSVYYMDPEAMAYAQYLKDNPDYKVLFDAVRNISPEDIDTVRRLLDVYRNQ